MAARPARGRSDFDVGGVRFKNCDIVNQLCVSHKLHLLSDWIAGDCIPLGGSRRGRLGQDWLLGWAIGFHAPEHYWAGWAIK